MQGGMRTGGTTLRGAEIPCKGGDGYLWSSFRLSIAENTGEIPRDDCFG